MIELYSLTGCPYCKKVENKLDQLNVAYQRNEVPMVRSRRTAVFETSGQYGVPVLVDPENNVDGLAESTDIIEYLEQTYGDTSRAKRQ